MFGRLISMSFGALVLSAAAPADAMFQITCYERIGGWCEEDGKCYENTKRPAEFRISTPSIPRGQQRTAGKLQECREGTCGVSWPAALKSNLLDDVLVSFGDSEFFQIHRDTGFFARSTLVSSVELGRVEHTFGKCVISDELGRSVH